MPAIRKAKHHRAPEAITRGGENSSLSSSSPFPSSIQEGVQSLLSNIQLHGSPSAFAWEFDTTPKSKKRKHIGVPSVPRPRNSFIIFRSYLSRMFSNSTDKNQKELSKAAGVEWRKLPESVKTLFQSMADEERERHRLKHPDYKYSPRQRESSDHCYVVPTVCSSSRRPLCSVLLGTKDRQNEGSSSSPTASGHTRKVILESSSCNPDSGSGPANVALEIKTEGHCPSSEVLVQISDDPGLCSPPPFENRFFVGEHSERNVIDDPFQPRELCGQAGDSSEFDASPLSEMESIEFGWSWKIEGQEYSSQEEFTRLGYDNTLGDFWRYINFDQEGATV